MHVGIVLGSRSQWSTINHTAKLLARLGISYEAHIITAHKNSKKLHEYANKAMNRGLEVIIIGSTLESYIPGIIASQTELPVIWVQTDTSTKKKNICDTNSDNNIGHTIRMLNTGTEGALNAALFAASMLGNKHPRIRENLFRYRSQNAYEKALHQNSRCTA